MEYILAKFSRNGSIPYEYKYENEFEREDHAYKLDNYHIKEEYAYTQDDWVVKGEKIYLLIERGSEKNNKNTTPCKELIKE